MSTFFIKESLHVKSTEDHLIEEHPLRGKLEIEVVGESGLSVVNPSTVFHFADFIV